MDNATINAIRSSEFAAKRRRPTMTHVWVIGTDAESVRKHLPMSVSMTSELGHGDETNYVCSAFMSYGYVLRVTVNPSGGLAEAMNHTYGGQYIQFDVIRERVSMEYPRSLTTLVEIIFTYLCRSKSDTSVLLPPKTPGTALRELLPKTMSERAIAERAGIDRAQLSRILNDRLSISDAVLTKICRCFPIDPATVWHAESQWKAYLTNCALRDVKPILPENYRKAR